MQKIRTLPEAYLSVFDQTMKNHNNRQVLTIDEDLYAGDDDMMYILRRLLAAASDSKLRQDMNVEDEYFRAIENRDTAIMARDKIIAEKDTQIAEKDSQIAEKNTQIAEKITQIAEKNTQIAEKDTQITEKDSQIAEKDILLGTMIHNLLRSGMDIQQVAQNTGLSVEKIQELLNNASS